MNVPTLNRLRLANPDFFSAEHGELGEFTDFIIERENEQFVFKLRTLHDTDPVYTIGANCELSYLRHGW